VAAERAGGSGLIASIESGQSRHIRSFRRILTI
jgi:hypothetical protein